MNEEVKKLLDWYLINKRDLPWRKDKNPYHIWISEIMLQQTRIEAVIPYYEKFMKEIPDISSLANVNEDKLLKLWQGLGYYNRARNLKKAAIEIMNIYQGVFPNKFSQIVKLPGIGEYTASAISSICFGEKEITVDGNVMRVFTRFYNDNSNISKVSTRNMIHDKLLCLEINDFGMFNEAIMELGETVCVPNGMPRCDVCPLQKKCLSNLNHNYYLFPVKDDKKEKEVVEMTVFIFVWNRKTIVQKRKDKGLLHNLYEFVNLLGFLSYDEVRKFAEDYGKVSFIKKSISYVHIFTHKKWKMQSYFIFMDEVKCPNLFKDISYIEDELALPTAFSPFLYALKEEIR